LKKQEENKEYSLKIATPIEETKIENSAKPEEK
jgi:hypothetical protein